MNHPGGGEKVACNHCDEEPKANAVLNKNNVAAVIGTLFVIFNSLRLFRHMG